MMHTYDPTRTYDPPKPKPSDEQVALVVSAIDVWPQADFVAWMECSGAMRLSMTEDGLTQTASFGRDGQIQGDWF